MRRRNATFLADLGDFAAIFGRLLCDFCIIFALFLRDFCVIFLWSARARKVEPVRLFKVLQVVSNSREFSRVFVLLVCFAR